MFISLSDIVTILEEYTYWLIFPLAIFEGPIIIIIAGFLAYLGTLNFFIAYTVVTAADILGDCLYYSIGRFWRSSTRIKKIGYFLGYSDKSEEFLENHFKKHKMKTFLVAKFAHGVGATVQIASGIAKVNFAEFVGYSILGTIPKVLILFTFGFYAGQSYAKIDGYLGYIAVTTLAVSILAILYFVVGKKLKNSIMKE